MSTPSLDPVEVRCPVLRGDRLGWRDEAGNLVENAIAVETSPLHVIVYVDRGMHQFDLRDDGHYWATWAPSDSTMKGKLLRLSRTRGAT